MKTTSSGAILINNEYTGDAVANVRAALIVVHLQSTLPVMCLFRGVLLDQTPTNGFLTVKKPKL